MISVLYIFLLIQCINAFYLNNNQIKTINKLIVNPNLKEHERQQVNHILYKAYENWAIKKALEFKELHKYKCSNIKKDELILSSKIGLFKSVQKYNGKYNFINYSSIYIKSELLNTLTEKYSTSILPKSYRTKSKSNLSKLELLKYKYALNVNLFSKYEQWQLEPILTTNENILENIINREEKTNLINELSNQGSNFTKRVFYLKFLLNENKFLSNSHVAKLMCCSEETIRKELKKIEPITVNI